MRLYAECQPRRVMIVGSMEWWRWGVVRREMARRIRAAKGVRQAGAPRGASQTAVGVRGGVKQTHISKMLRNHKLGPTVETFLRAIMGLGLKPSEFFAELERGWTPDTPPEARPPDDPDQEEADSAMDVVRLLVRAMRRADEATKRRKL